MTRATGTFDVTLVPLEQHEAAVSRMSIEKQFRGDLDATSAGEMLAAMTDVEGSAGYVALERVSGTLHGRSGAFVLHRTQNMSRSESNSRSRAQSGSSFSARNCSTASTV